MTDINKIATERTKKQIKHIVTMLFASDDN